MLRETYNWQDKQRSLVSTVIVLGSMLVGLIVWAVMIKPMQPAPLIALIATPLTTSLGMIVLGYLRARDIGSGRLLDIFQGLMTINILFTTALPVCWRLAAVALIVIAPFIGYSVGRLCYRYEGTTYDG